MLGMKRYRVLLCHPGLVQTASCLPWLKCNKMYFYLLQHHYHNNMCAPVQHKFVIVLICPLSTSFRPSLPKIRYLEINCIVWSWHGGSVPPPRRGRSGFSAAERGAGAGADVSPAVLVSGGSWESGWRTAEQCSADPGRHGRDAAAEAEVTDMHFGKWVRVFSPFVQEVPLCCNLLRVYWYSSHQK